uniref:Uncharacterized protein n=1 Tax=Panagrolaimus davidi TaxID=227884 RepID=A0A914QBA8_9BILA
MGIRGNYKSENKVFGSNKMLPLCLEINRQCRGVNYCCPNDFPKNIAFLHFVLKDDQISCSSNATKYYAPHVFIPSLDFGEIDYIQRLEDKLSEISGKLEYDKRIEIFIITFENYLKNELSDEIASKMYVAAVKWKSQIKCGIAEITLNAANKRIVSCVALQYDDKLDAVKIKEYLHLCNKCDDLRLKEEAVAYLPQQIKLAHISLKNIRNNYAEFEFLRKRKLSESDIFNNSTDTIYLHPKIKQRNHIINNENEDFLLI